MVEDIIHDLFERRNIEHGHVLDLGVLEDVRIHGEASEKVESDELASEEEVEVRQRGESMR